MQHELDIVAFLGESDVERGQHPLAIEPVRTEPPLRRDEAIDNPFAERVQARQVRGHLQMPRSLNIENRHRQFEQQPPVRLF